jgi:hypothetical protein
LEALERGLVVFHDLLKLGNLLGERESVAGKLVVVDAGFAKSGCECLVDLVVGEALGFVRERDFLSADGQRGQRLRGLPRALIHQAPARGSAGVASDGLQMRHRVAGHPRKDGGEDQDCQQNRKRNQSRLPKNPFAKDFRGFSRGGRIEHDSILTGNMAAST